VNVLLRAGDHGLIQSTIRRNELLRRAGKDPIVMDTRSSEEVLDDVLPYERWARELNVINRAGYRTWAELLKARHEI
jgi:hypothetical protein